MIPDSELLKRFAQGRDEAAFAELVGRHVNHVYSTGLRLVGGDRQLAEDIAQIVFTALARKAGALRNYRALSSWLHTSARFAAANLVRSEQRRRARDQEVLPMLQTFSDSDPDWHQIRAVLDETIGALNEPDREALLLRYFETKTFAEIGGCLGVRENAARMRIERAVDKLRSRLALRGITSTAAALSAALAQVAVVEAPASLGSQITARSVEAVGGSSSWFASQIFSTSAQIGLVGLVLIGLVMAVILNRPAQPRSSPTGVSSGPKAEVVPTGGDTPRQARGKSETPAWQGLELVFADEATGASVTNRLATLKSWDQRAGRMIEHELELREGRCEVPFEPEQWGDQRILRCQLEGYADVRLRWNVNEADPPAIADSLIVRLVRPTPIGGRVVDISGKPVARAIVGVSTDDFPPSASFSEDHCLDYTTAETDVEGRWRLHRVAPEMAGRISVEARHPDYADSTRVTITREPDRLEDLLREKLVLRLGNWMAVPKLPTDTNQRATILIRGSVVDTNQQPIAGAQVRAGNFSTSRTTDATASLEGRFTIAALAAGDGILTAEAEGFAAGAVVVKAAPNMPEVQIMLRRGRGLRLLITDALGAPLPQASLTLQSRPHELPGDGSELVPQIHFRRKADERGAILWPNAPELKLEFSVRAEGYLDHFFNVVPDDEEHVIVLKRALLITGTVHDSTSGEIIPKFRLGIGYPQKLADGSVRAAWVPLDRFWINFTNGKFRKTITEPAISIPQNAGYFFRFEAEGHAAFVTRWYAPNEGEVQLEVKLKPVEDIVAVAYSVEGNPAADAQIGFLMDGTDARLVPGGFDFMLGNAPVWVRRADALGSFRVPGGEKIERVVVAAPGGYAEISVEELRKAGAVRLGPWARVEGKLEDHGQPVAKARLELGLVAQDQRAPLRLAPQAFETTTGEDGHFVFPRVPPVLMCVRRVDGGVMVQGDNFKALGGKTTEVRLEK